MNRPTAVALPSSSARSRLMTNGRRNFPTPNETAVNTSAIPPAPI